MIKTVRNWSEYNKSLQKRGGLVFNFDESFLSTLYHTGDQARGGQKIYTSAMYEYLLTIKILCRLPWRAAVGFGVAALKKAFPGHDIDVPHYAHACRAARKLSLRLKQFMKTHAEGLILAFDSTGINVYTTSGWHQRKYGKNTQCRRSDQWKKIHVALDLDTSQVMAVSYSNSQTNDCEEIESLCGQITGKVRLVLADGAYDTRNFYQQIEKWEANALIPPACTSKRPDELKKQPHPPLSYLKQRDAVIKKIRKSQTFEEGLALWQKREWISPTFPN